MTARKTGAFNSGFSANAPTELHSVRARSVAEPPACDELGCGQADIPDLLAPALTAPAGWVFVIVSGSTEPGRWYCSGMCAIRGMAKAELGVTTGGGS